VIFHIPTAVVCVKNLFSHLMQDKYFEDQNIDKQDYTKIPLAVADYDNCTFLNCNFAGTDLSEMNFAECIFENCDLSNAKLVKTGLKDVQFKGCKLLGLHFNDCEAFLFQVGFDNCSLNLSSFYKRKLAKTRFINCSLKEVDFAEADLSNATFINSDLTTAIFDNTNLEKADLRTAYNYTIDPERNKLKKAKLSVSGLCGLLEKYDLIIE